MTVPRKVSGDWWGEVGLRETLGMVMPRSDRWEPLGKWGEGA